MNKILRSGSWILPAFVLPVLALTLTLSSCNNNCQEAPINEDSVKTHAISIAEAAALTANFRNTIDTIVKKCPETKGINFGYSEAFNRDTYQVLLKQKDSSGNLAAGIRIYYGLGKTGQVQLVMVPYDQNGNDILHHLVAVDTKPVPGVTPHTEALTVDGAQAMEEGQHCPVICPPGHSPLQP